MDRIDALDASPERLLALSPEMLSEVHDSELQQIVQDAAKELVSPMALVTLVLEEVQFFKAHCGLPDDLAAARATPRDVSFCQFVVRDDAPFEVNDAPRDSRVPQKLVEDYDIRSYLGVPIHSLGVAIGSLCVLDTRKRKFSDEDRRSLTRLAEHVDARLRDILEARRQARVDMSQRASKPALDELRESLEPVHGLAAAGHPSLVSLRAFLRASRHAMDGGEASPAGMAGALEAADAALARLEDLLEDIRMAALDSEDCLAALEALEAGAEETCFSEVIPAAQDLVRGRTREVGAAPLPDFEYDPALRLPRPFAVALVATALNTLAERLATAQSTAGIRMRIRGLGNTAELIFSSPGLDAAAAAEVSSFLAEQVGELPTVRIRALEGSVCMVFRVVSQSGDE